MRGRIFALGGLYLGAALAASRLAVAADDDEALPAVHVLPCTEKCASITPPSGISQPKPIYPMQYIDWLGTYVESGVVLQYTIGTDGHVSGIAVLHLIGPRKFADYTVDAVKNWTYKPPLSDGQPVALSHKLYMTFRVQNAPVGARPQTVAAYESAVGLIKDGKLDDAFARLSDAMARPELNFYERVMMTNLIAAIDMARKDYRLARRVVGQATFYPDEGVPPTVVKNLWRVRIQTDLHLGDLGDAILSLERIKKRTWYDPADPLVKIVADTRANVDALSDFGAEAEIPPPEEADGFLFPLYRRTFSFGNISGSLDKFTMSCKERVIESQITEKAEWHVPKDWSDCELLVRGKPGTTFQILQFKD